MFLRNTKEIYKDNKPSHKSINTTIVLVVIRNLTLKGTKEMFTVTSK